MVFVASHFLFALCVSFFMLFYLLFFAYSYFIFISCRRSAIEDLA